MSDAEDLEPVYLTLEDVLELYAAIIGGCDSRGDRAAATARS